MSKYEAIWRKIRTYGINFGEDYEVCNIQPDEIFHLGAQSHVRVSFDMPEYTGDIVAMGTTRILETIRKSNKSIKFYQASSSEMFGTAKPPQSETTPFQPASPYACAKLYSYWMVENYRKGYGIFACNGILFNHESPRRGETFVTRKITRAVVNIIAGKQDKLYLGNLDAKRDWGYAPEYVEAMWLMLQQEKADDYVIGTEESHSVREFVEQTFGYVGIEIEWQGTGENEKGIIKKLAPYNEECNNNLSNGDCVVLIDPKYFRPTEVDYLLSDTTKMKQKLGWKPKITFCDLVKIMVDYDLLLMGQKPVGEGIKINREKGFHWTENKITAG